MSEQVTPPELGQPTVTYHLWSTITRSSELVEVTLPEIDNLEDTKLQDALWAQHMNTMNGDGLKAIHVYTSSEYGTHIYTAPVYPSNL